MPVFVSLYPIMLSFKSIIFSTLLILNHSGISQDTSDVYRLKNLDYMEHQDQVDCESHDGTSLDHRICINLEFQEKDAELNSVLTHYLEQCDSEDERNIQLNYHDEWLKYRRDMSSAKSEGYSGHLLGITYLNTMLNITIKRIEELNLLI